MNSSDCRFIKSLQAHLVQILELKAIRLLHQALQAHLVQILELKAILPASSEPEKANSELSNERKIKEKGYRLNELTAYPYDLIDVDDDANKDELAKKLNDVITHKNGAIAIVGGSFFSKCNKFTAYWIVNKQIYKIWNKESNQHT
nr:hypothetical protein [Mycoplasmopsis bovis]